MTKSWEEEFDELIANAEPTDFFENLRKSRENQPLIDEQVLRRGQDWSRIGSQVVGAEDVCRK